MLARDDRIPLLYLAPWVDVGGSDKGTLDWFRFLHRDRFRASLITTQPSPNRRLDELAPYAEEVWNLPELMDGNEFPRFILTFIHTRGVQVVHIMNSRVAFELLPDIAHLPHPPRVVVQLHVEEPDCSGYVRYVTTRYGNLVDAFSVSSQALAGRLDRYDVPGYKRRVILTGVDGEREFSPQRVRPIDGLDPELVHILSPIRLTAQKDPMLTIAVAAALKRRGLQFRLHVLGEGELLPAVADRVKAMGINQEVILHGASLEIARWYAACDLVLLTSGWEGVPYVACEAMAMATPIVAPELPGLVEVVTPDAGLFVSEQADPDAYADALLALAADPVRRRRIGARARERALAELSLKRMADEHRSLYDVLLRTPRPEDPESLPPSLSCLVERPASPGLRDRTPGAKPLVSVIVPCFNHGRYLPDCVSSIREQTYSAIEMILVDNGSTDPETLAAIAQIDANEWATVLRLPVNQGPSGARNAAIELARGRYILPLDADNLLVPGAVEALVEQLSCAGERIGFVYPNYDFFGNRREFYEPPSYNLHALLESNYCDTSSLIDRKVFDRGFRYPEDFGLGYEDWDLVLTLAEHGIYGEPSHARTLRYRKHGFTRADLVEVSNVPFVNVVSGRHPNLYDSRARASLKGEWRPAVSVIPLGTIPDGTEALANLVAAAARQTCDDFELVIRTERDVWPTNLGGRLRRIPSELATSLTHAMACGIETARGRYLLATYDSPARLLADPAMIEKLLRILQAHATGTAIALAEDRRAVPTLRVLDAPEVNAAQLSALCWSATGPAAPPAELELGADDPLETVARWLSANTTLQWRQLRVGRRISRTVGPSRRANPIGAPRHARRRDVQIRANAEPELPGLPPGVADRVRHQPVWTPPQTRLLCRHLHYASGRYVFTNDPNPPPGCSPPHILGSLRILPLLGTSSLFVTRDGTVRRADAAPIDAPELLGFVERAPLPLFDALMVGRHRLTGQDVLLGGEQDPLAVEVDDWHGIGYIEAYPIHPRLPDPLEVPYGLAGLVRTLDLAARRHRYGVGHIPSGQLVGELGAVLTSPTGDCDPLFIDEAGLVTIVEPPRLRGLHAAAGDRSRLTSAARWTAAPLTWRGFSPPGPRLRATVRRARDSGRILLTKPIPVVPARPSDPAGYLLRPPGGNVVPLYAGRHPVTGDQLLSNTAAEPRDLGYDNVALLGYLVARAPLTGRLGTRRPGIPWASRFGQMGRSR